VKEAETIVVRLFHRIYNPALRFLLNHRVLVVGMELAFSLGTFFLIAPRLGSEFLPHLEEGNFWIRASMPITLSLEDGEASARKMREILLRHPEVLTVVSQHGRPDYAKGYASELDVAAQESQLAQVAASLPPLLKQLAQQRDLLAALSGGFPNQDLAEKFELSNLQLPQELPVSLPSQLVEQRPDVRQAEENLHSASAQIGIAVANRLPSFALTADAGSMAVVLGRLFSDGNGIWDVGAGVTQPIIDAGTLGHRERAAQAAFTQTAEQYRSTVLTAFQNVADTLNALQQDAASVTLDLARKQYQSGYASYLALLSAEQTYQQAVINLVQAQANRYADTAALFQALGGGW